MGNYCPLIENTKRGQNELSAARLEQITAFTVWYEVEELLPDRNLFFMGAHFEDSCLFIVLFRSLQSYLISWTLNVAHFDKG